MQPARFSTVLSDMVQASLNDVHTMLPAKVTSVDYGSGRVTVQPLIKNYIGLNKTQSYPQLADVPLFVLSGNAGKASITFPIKGGDTVIVLFSERDPSSALQGNGDAESAPSQTTPLGLYPLGVLPCIFTDSGAKEIDPDKVVISNEKAIIHLSKEGNISMQNDNGSVELADNGDISLLRDGQSFKLSSSGLEIKTTGNVSINGLIITPDGKLTDGGGLSFDKHRHDKVETGEGISGTPVK